MTVKLTGLRRSLISEPVKDFPEVQGKVIKIPMTALERRRVRRRLLAPDGTELLLAFPTGTVLMPGQVLEVHQGNSYVVAAADEEVAVVRPKTMGQTAHVAHAVGNLHRDFLESPEKKDEFLVLWDAPIELLLTRLEVLFTRESRPFLGRPSWEHE